MEMVKKGESILIKISEDEELELTPEIQKWAGIKITDEKLEEQDPDDLFYEIRNSLTAKTGVVVSEEIVSLISAIHQYESVISPDYTLYENAHVFEDGDYIYHVWTFTWINHDKYQDMVVYKEKKK
ncbi:MAG: hypothetical protein ACXADY_22015 [Candidatus Hodarchaeales archaeon]